MSTSCDRVRVTLAAPSGTSVEALHEAGHMLMEALLLVRRDVAALRDVRVCTDGVEGTATVDATVVAASAAQAEELLTGLVRGVTPWPVVGVSVARM